VALDTVERRLAAILTADVVGCSRLKASDAEGALSRLRPGFLDPTIAKRRGRIIKLVGDDARVEFASVVGVVRRDRSADGSRWINLFAI
jgi:class 3 adenylate cyclase